MALVISNEEVSNAMLSCESCCLTLSHLTCLSHLLQGMVDGDATVELFFPADAMNDILKSINVTSEHEHTYVIYPCIKAHHLLTTTRRTLTYEVPSASSASTTLTPISTHKDLYSRLIRETVLVKTDKGESVEGLVIAVDLDDKDKATVYVTLV